MFTKKIWKYQICIVCKNLLKEHWLTVEEDIEKLKTEIETILWYVTKPSRTCMFNENFLQLNRICDRLLNIV